METYYGPPLSWMIRDGFKAAHNVLLAIQTRDLLYPDVVSAAFARSLTYLAGLRPIPEALSTEASLCFLARAFAESNVYATAQRPDGRIERLCWHRIKDVIAACNRITATDIGAARAALRAFPGVLV